MSLPSVESNNGIRKEGEVIQKTGLIVWFLHCARKQKKLVDYYCGGLLLQGGDLVGSHAPL